MINSLFPHKRYSFINESVLEDLPDKDFQYIEENVIVLKLKKGQVVFHEGTTPIGFYIIRIGKVKKYALGLDGKEHIFYLAKENQIIGHHELISKETYSCSSACLTDCMVNLIPKKVFLEVLSNNPSIRDRLLRSIAHEFGVFINNSKILAQQNVRERCAISIIKLKEFFGSDEEGFKISRKDHSNIVGTSVESLVRVLHDFKEEKVIKISENCIYVIDIKKLVGICNVACGTSFNRSGLISFPVTRHIPYVLFSIRKIAFFKSRTNFSCLIASCVFASLDIVSLPSSKALNVGEVSSVPLLPSFL